jgi:hypothetical protein
MGQIEKRLPEFLLIKGCLEADTLLGLSRLGAVRGGFGATVKRRLGLGLLGAVRGRLEMTAKRLPVFLLAKE